ncbi:Hachiman antiphage defense system protein HamA [Pedobacter gandavensis]|uniref:Hachiman antiphage defense system protein HamA n=1 Tax=Pedobacter gandavensis TaxID=2679963 RepID=UPI00292E1B88|nr:Hachiman antiphage defense system protein HamA [Pedobacter gandavensis]
MKDSLKKLIENTILFEYKLPHIGFNIDRTCVTHIDLGDDCYKVADTESLNRIIYESILYYSYDDFQLTGGDHQKMFIKAFNSKFKYNHSASDLAKRKLGVYGEALLYAILKCLYSNDILVSRGYFYDLQKKTEVTGYDCFHLIQKDDEIELWFGETKFYEDCKAAIDSVFKNIEKAISDDYLVNTNFTTILQGKGNIADRDSKLYKILDKWEKCIIDSLQEEFNENGIKLVYPVLITFNLLHDNYDDTIKTAIKHINDNYSHLKFDNITIDYSIFFILIPVDNVKSTKETIIKWIDNKEPLTL